MTTMPYLTQAAFDMLEIDPATGLPTPSGATVRPDHVCPGCGESAVESLVLADPETVVCQSCGLGFDPPATS